MTEVDGICFFKSLLLQLFLIEVAHLFAIVNMY